MKIVKKESDPKQSIFNIIYIFMGLFVLVMGYFAYFLIVRSNEVINSTYNKRQEVLSKRILRGSILSADGEILAKTVLDKDGNETREYPFDDIFAHVVGRYDKGKTGIEESENIRLLTSNVNSLDVMYSDLIGEKSPGDNVITTLNTKLQQVAYDALGNNRGAVVIMEPSTGKILAMVSKPSYNPNKVKDNWDKLVEDKNSESPLMNRATQGLYPPGSTFKVLTSLEYIRENPLYLKYKYDCNGRIEYEGMAIHCYNNKSHGKLDLPLSFAKSCNTSYASMGKDLDKDKFFSLCEDFLFNKNLPITMASNPSSFTLRQGQSSVKEAMQTAIGQGNTLITPLHNAMIASTIANGGVMMKPYIIDHIENADGGVVKKYTPRIHTKPITPGEAKYIAEMMRKVVTDGTGSKLKGLDIKAAGKTGSADHAEGKAAHAWFIGFAPYDDPEIAVSIIVESVGTGSDYAVPIAKKIFQAYDKMN
ncbi:penicillin-binding protein 2 [Lachnospiraceae bacterium MD1]|jgi:peptidoglycan glycosyltransferase|uniref:Penicillin-binding protein 2 n=1 Tax=Variimorphobacter saccharofermentans TaxID=2755051 RepID=A0A839K1Y5_9FIRM|nr:penicillin-binding transpeptidase domain-containing protein [Variimorphobacter saccharofermentans]MBB2183636.1 penicillin-binding protein 2 [Variimorphobacter saccharofermentans]